MSFTVKFYSFSKRSNSTKQPSDSGTSYDCILKDGSAVISPIIQLDLGLTADPSDLNYCYIAKFERYYYVTDWTFDRALWTAHLQVDVLATYKSEIGGTNMYILRASAENDGDVIDTLYPTETGCSYDRVTKSNFWKTDGTGQYIVGVVSQSSLALGSVAYYKMGSGKMAELVTDLIGNTVTVGNGYTSTDMSLALQRSLVNPIQYIKSCVYLPVDNSDIAGLPAALIKVFAWTTSVAASELMFPYLPVNINTTWDIPKHPQTSARGNYVNSSPYTVLTLTIPPFGTIDIDTSVTCNATYLYTHVYCDIVTGKGILIVECNNTILSRVEAQIGIPIQLSQVTRDYIGGITSVLSSVGSIASGNFIGAAAGVGQAAEALSPRVNTVGTTGSFAGLFGTPQLNAQFFSLVADDNASCGRPLCKKRQPSNLTGYMLVQDGDVAINGTKAEADQIRSLLEGGFYYE